MIIFEQCLIFNKNMILFKMSFNSILNWNFELAIVVYQTFAGKKVYQKLAEVRAAMQALASDLMVVTALEDIACKLTFDQINQNMLI